MKELLALKSQYKTLTGVEYKPTNASASGSAQKENKKPVSAPASASTTSASSDEAEKLAQKITEQGDKVRDLKAKPAPKVGQILVGRTSES